MESRLMHLKRWLTSILALPLLLVLIFKGGPTAFLVLIGLVNLIALNEYLRIALYPRTDRAVALLSGLSGTAVLIAAHGGRFGPLAAVVVVNLLISAAMTIRRFARDSGALTAAFRQTTGLIYVSGLLACLILLRNGPDGPAWIFLTLCIAFGGDTGAFYVGRRFGRHKLSAVVSPNKTIEGALGGIGASIVTGALAKGFLLPAVPWGPGMLLMIAAAVVGQIGDLFESAMKRASGIKDSGGVLPGHGGILDRIDALLFAAPVVLGFNILLFG
jgi:phosphatidate cytidylyltransferase